LYGTLRTLEEQFLQTGSILTIPFGESRVPVVYESNDDSFFSLPEPSNETEPDEFQYKLEAYDSSTGELIGSSGGDSFPATQKLHVRNVNHPPELLVPQASVQQAKSITDGKPMAIISGVEVLDDDKDVNHVRVDLEVETGALTLNENFRGLADFDSCRFRWQLGWRCVGSGVGDRKMAFLAKPSHVKSILTELEYDSLLDHKDDNLLISVFDGIGGDCIADYEQTFSTERIGPKLTRYPSVQDGCYLQRAFVDIVGIPDDFADPGSSIDEPVNRATALGWAIYVTIGIVAFLVVGFFLRIVFFGFGHRRRGAAVGPG